MSAHYEQTNLDMLEYGEARDINTPFEKALNKSFFISKHNLYNIRLPKNKFISVDTADRIAHEISRFQFRIDMGEEISELEKFAFSLLVESPQ